MGHLQIIRRLEQENSELKKRVEALEKSLKKKEKKEEVEEGKVAEHKLLKT